MLSRDEEKYFEDEEKDDCRCRTNGYQVKCRSRCASPPIEPQELKNLTERLRFFLNEGHIWIDQGGLSR